MFDNGFIKNYTSLPIAYYQTLLLQNISADMKVHTALHNHSETEIFVVEQGQAYMQLDGRHWELSQGDILIINPMEVHCGEFYGNNFGYYCLDFDSNLLDYQKKSDSAGYASPVYTNHIPVDHAQNKVLRSLLDNILRLLKDKPAGWQCRVRGSLLFISAVLEENHLYLTPDQKGTQSKNDRFVKSVLHYIEENYDKPITSRELSHALSYNHSYLCRLFKGSFGRNFNNYLTIYRLCKAKILLETTNDAISQIAISTGFNNTSYFSQQFRRFLGQSPSEYRKTHV